MTDIRDKAVQEALEGLECYPRTTPEAARLADAQGRIVRTHIKRLKDESRRLHEASIVARNEAMTERVKCNEARADNARLNREVRVLREERDMVAVVAADYAASAGNNATPDEWIGEARRLIVNVAALAAREQVKR